MFLSSQKSDRRLWPYVVIAFVTVATVAILVFYWRLAIGLSSRLFQSVFEPQRVIETVVRSARFGSSGSSIELLVPRLLGFDKPRTYLVLFQNNTELRPSGGFIGVYAVITMNKGAMTVHTIEGTELLDRRAPPDWRIDPPAPIKEHLGVDRWYFRDSNWSPDFPTAAEQALTMYKAEGGILADNIDTVIAITPSILERLLVLIGTVNVEGKTFTPANAVELLEYEVEYGYKESGRETAQRKAIIRPLVEAVTAKIAVDVFLRPGEYIQAFEDLLQERHFIFYSPSVEWQKIIDAHGWSGRVSTTTQDYVLWVDANLGALKTDHAVERVLTYNIFSPNSGTTQKEITHTAVMSYKHTGTFDWRTTRYQTYARVYVPKGAQLRAVNAIDSSGVESLPLKDVESGEELGKKWFGQFFVVEPGETRSLEFAYTLPSLNKTLYESPYTLLIQKQAGTIGHELTLNLNFDRTIIGAQPAEEVVEWGNTAYRLKTDLRLDKEFRINF